MGFSKYSKGIPAKETKELTFVESEQLLDSDQLYIAIGHYEGTKTTADKLYVFSYYTDKNGNVVRNKQADVKLSVDKLPEFFEALRKFMEE